ncbi:hypothetical protein EPI10_016956 [Gossypium australe]|uniref:Uncharacterized protein n=1 Tax=Gossypium australe TaxID=47621 RepID=A0A5B6VQB8_9ROSI|nr:hypothetical protein EPI10_016956 [Gossypium australe]
MWSRGVHCQTRAAVVARVGGATAEALRGLGFFFLSENDKSGLGPGLINSGRPKSNWFVVRLSSAKVRVGGVSGESGFEFASSSLPLSAPQREGKKKQ